MQQQQFERNQAAFFSTGAEETVQRAASRQDFNAASDVFWGNEKKERGQD